jgi:hypothetical protein
VKTIHVRYKTTPEHVAANEAAIHAVFDELRARAPAGLRYSSFRDEDGWFVHLAAFEGAENPLLGLPAFAEFQRQLEGHFLERPVVTVLAPVDSYAGAVPS